MSPTPPQGGQRSRKLRKDRPEQPQTAGRPIRVVNQEWDDLSVSLEAGCITVEFRRPQPALEKLLLARPVAINDFDRFERRTRNGMSDRLESPANVSVYSWL